MTTYKQHSLSTCSDNCLLGDVSFSLSRRFRTAQICSQSFETKKVRKKQQQKKMSDVEPGKAKAAGIVGIIIGVTGLVNFICGCIYTSFGPKDASGLWSGIGVSST